MFSRISLHNRVLLLLGGVFFLSLTTVLFSYQQSSARILQKKVAELSGQTLQSMGGNIEDVLDTAGSYTKLILADPDVQALLFTRTAQRNLERQRSVQILFNSLMSTFPEIDSLMVADMAGRRLSVSKGSLPDSIENGNPDSPWFRRAVDKQGSLFFYQEEGEETFSCIRVINHLDFQYPIGVVVLTLPRSVLNHSFDSLFQGYGTEFLILDSQGEILTGTEGFRLTENEQDGDIIRRDRESWLVNSLTIPSSGWTIISHIPYSVGSDEAGGLRNLFLLLIVINGILLFLGAYWISGLIVRPIERITGAMTGSHRLSPLHFTSSLPEISRLRDGYNSMLLEIDSLIKRIREEQVSRRELELKALQAQIKPHFLYNTLDSINSLALMGRTEDVYALISELGSYYRLSLSRGEELISLEEDVRIVRHYLSILKVRYEKLFVFTTDLEPSTLGCLIPKLTLQPLVENAVYHGLKPMKREGQICLRSRMEGKNLVIELSDDGAGIEKDYNGGFGLSGTLDRLNLFSQGRAEVHIQGEKNRGTDIQIRIPGKGRPHE